MDSAGMETMMRSGSSNGSSHEETERPPRRRRPARDNDLARELLAMSLRTIKVGSPVLLLSGPEIPVVNSLEVLAQASAELAADFIASTLPEREWRFWYRRGVRFAKLSPEHLTEFVADVRNPKNRAKLVKAWNFARAKRKEQERQRERDARAAAHLARPATTATELYASIRSLRPKAKRR